MKETETLRIEVSGVVCSFCAYGLEKTLSRLPNVNGEYFGDGVLIDLKKGVATIALQPGRPIDFDKVLKAIEKGGYTLRGLRFVVRGQLAEQQGALYVKNGVTGQRFRLLDTAGKPWQNKDDLKNEVLVSAYVPAKVLEEGDFSKQPRIYVESIRVDENQV